MTPAAPPASASRHQESLQALLLASYYATGTAVGGDMLRPKCMIALTNEMTTGLEVAGFNMRREGNAFSGLEGFPHHAVEVPHGDAAGGGLKSSGGATSTTNGPAAAEPLKESDGHRGATAPAADTRHVSVRSTSAAPQPLPLDLIISSRLLAQLTSAYRTTTTDALRLTPLAPAPPTGPSAPSYASSPRMTAQAARGGHGGGGSGAALSLSAPWRSPRGRYCEILAHVSAKTRRRVSSPEQLAHDAPALLDALNEAQGLVRAHGLGGAMAFAMTASVHACRAVVLHALGDPVAALEAAEATLTAWETRLSRFVDFMAASLLVQLVPLWVAAHREDGVRAILRHLTNLATMWPVGAVLLGKAQRRIMYAATGAPTAMRAAAAGAAPATDAVATAAAPATTLQPVAVSAGGRVGSAAALDGSAAAGNSTTALAAGTNSRSSTTTTTTFSAANGAGRQKRQRARPGVRAGAGGFDAFVAVSANMGGAVLRRVAPPRQNAAATQYAPSGGVADAEYDRLRSAALAVEASNDSPFVSSPRQAGDVVVTEADASAAATDAAGVGAVGAIKASHARGIHHEQQQQQQAGSVRGHWNGSSGSLTDTVPPDSGHLHHIARQSHSARATPAAAGGDTEMASHLRTSPALVPLPVSQQHKPLWRAADTFPLSGAEGPSSSDGGGRLGSSAGPRDHAMGSAASEWHNTQPIGGGGSSGTPFSFEMLVDNSLFEGLQPLPPLNPAVAAAASAAADAAADA